MISTMRKQSIIPLLLLLNIFGAISTILPRYSGKNLTVTEKMLIQILKTCNLGLNNTIFYTGENPDLTQALLTTPSSVGLESWSLISNMEDERLDNIIARSGIVVVFNSIIEYIRIRTIIDYWKCTEDCKVIFLFKLFNTCKYVKDILVHLGSSYLDISYYICIDKKYGPIVFTRDKYYNIQREYWSRFSVDVDSLYNGTFYFRPYSKDLCRNFDFERRKPENVQVYLGVPVKVKEKANLKEDLIVIGDLSKLKSGYIHPSILILGTLSKIQFAAYIKTFLYGNGSYTESQILQHFLLLTSVDVIARLQNLILDVIVAHSHPLYYEGWVILSHKRAEATPLQKITKFYGIWTLISLIILSIITFVVIYLKSNRNATLAAFDVLRLLKNSGVEIPLNTLSLKIFFCMIFLYFMVIHATFSGNLPKFLTIPEFHDSIDSLEDLSNSRITTIYDKGFFTDLNEDDKSERKIKYIDSYDDLFNLFKMDKNSVCIIDKPHADIFIAERGKSMNKFHMSKNDIANGMSAAVVRSRFYMREKIQWASTYMFDVGLNYKWESRVINAQRNITKQLITSQIKFREIAVNDLLFAFIFFIIGNTVGLVCFLIELVVGKKYYRKISFEFFKKSTTLKRKKARTSVRRIIVRPRLDSTGID